MRAAEFATKHLQQMLAQPRWSHKRSQELKSLCRRGRSDQRRCRTGAAARIAQGPADPSQGMPTIFALHVTVAELPCKSIDPPAQGFIKFDGLVATASVTDLLTWHGFNTCRRAPRRDNHRRQLKPQIR